jgi:hypothetical protein
MSEVIWCVAARTLPAPHFILIDRNSTALAGHAAQILNALAAARSLARRASVISKGTPMTQTLKRPRSALQPAASWALGHRIDRHAPAPARNDQQRADPSAVPGSGSYGSGAAARIDFASASDLIHWDNPIGAGPYTR